MQREWTQEEVKYLKQWYCKKPTSEIMKQLNRSANSIRRKADRLGITDASNSIRGKEWTEVELQYLKTWYGKKTISQIARDLRRTSSSVQNKAFRLGITDPEKQQDSRPWTEEEENYLSKTYEKRGSAYIANKLKRSIDSVRRKAQSLGLNVYAGEEIHVKTLGECFESDSRVVNRWIDQFGLPCRRIQRGQTEYTTIDIKTFWKWAASHKDIIPWAKYSYHSLPPQPSWVDDAIREYNQTQKNHRKPITAFDKSTVARMRRQGYNYNDIAKELNRTVESIKHICRDI